MPPARVLHQNAGWLKAEGKQIFSIVGNVWGTTFSGALLRRTFMWKITVIAYIFSLPVSSLPPKTWYFWRWSYCILQACKSTHRRLCSHSHTTPWCACCLYLFIPPTHLHTHACSQVRVHSSVLDTDVHMESSCLLTPASTGGSLIKPFTLLVLVSSSAFVGLLEVTLFILRICRAGCLHWGVCWPGWRLHYLWWGVAAQW